MSYAKEALIAQVINLILCMICLIGAIWVYSEDTWSNRNERIIVDRFISLTKGQLAGIEDEELLFRALKREVKHLFAAVMLYGFVALCSIVHLVLCICIRHIQYRQTFNICFHLGASFFFLIGTIVFGISFGTNNDLLEQLFDDLVGKSTDKQGRKIRNPCFFPPPKSGVKVKLSEQDCQERYTKVTLMCIASLNIIFYWVTSYFIGCFVEVDDSAELLYAELASQLPPLRDISKLPPLPYYARPLSESPTSKRRDKHINRVEVPEEWPYI